MAVELAVFCRAPEPGRCKTRLIPELGPEGAARLYAEMLADCVHAAKRAKGISEVHLYCHPDTTHPALVQLAEGYGLQMRRQQGEDLGERMLQALEEGCGLIIGSDAPTLPVAHLEQAAAAVDAGAPLVLGPVSDGGYYTIGMATPEPRYFAEMPWGGPDVFPGTLRRAQAAGVTPTLLPFWYDIDEPQDLALLRAHLPVLRAVDPEIAPRTAARLQLG